MSCRIEDYALVGDTQTAALVGRDGSIDWLCLPRFDSPACFAALLGDASHGRWCIAPASEVRQVRRRYRAGTLVLETEIETADGVVRLVDFMPPRGKDPDLVRIVEGVRGRVPMAMELVVRFDYGSIVPWVRRAEGGVLAVGGPDALLLRTAVQTRGEGLTTVAEFEVAEGERVPFVLSWHPSHEPAPAPLDALAEVEATERWWAAWSGCCGYGGPYREAVLGSLVTLKALTYAPTGGIIAAPTTSLPEWPGGVRNWDYRYCWLRDATLTLDAMLLAGHTDEAVAFREWLLRAVAGDSTNLRIMYGLSGERRLTELELGWLPGFEGSKPVRLGNAAASQLQLDVYGQVMGTLYEARSMGVPPLAYSWSLLRTMMESLEQLWTCPDEGIWEVRGPRRHFTHSKVMVWVAFDRAVKSIERFGLEGPLDRWRALRDRVHEEVCTRGFDASRGTFTQSYGSAELDASLLRIPLVGFLPADDPRVVGTLRAIERGLVRDGLVLRYATHDGGAVDGLPGKEGAFLACSFWLADNYALAGRRRQARDLFERLLALRNDLGLLAEEYDPSAGRQLGNFPQAFSHLALIGTAFTLAEDHMRPVHQHPSRAGSEAEHARHHG